MDGSGSDNAMAAGASSTRGDGAGGETDAGRCSGAMSHEQKWTRAVAPCQPSRDVGLVDSQHGVSDAAVDGSMDPGPQQAQSKHDAAAP